MSLVEMVGDVVDESIELPTSINEFHIEPRCHVCRNDEVRKKVNDLLVSGASYAMILRALGEDNATLEKCDRVTIDSIRNHCRRHFPVQNVAQATYREILERRAREAQIDFADGVATAITPLALLETVMVKGYENLVDERTTVSYRDGVAAALKLGEELRREEPQIEIARMRVEVGRLVEIVRAHIPQEMWPEIQAAIKGDAPIRRQPTEPVQSVRMVAIDDTPDQDGD